MIYFSIIIPVYQDADRLHKLLKALDKQTLDVNYWEVVIVNNDSKNPLSIEVDFMFSWQIIQETTPGSYVARNTGIEVAKGKILAFIDADCIPDENWILNAYKYFERDINREIGVLTGSVPLFFKNVNSLSPTEVYEKYTGFTTEAYAREGHAITANWFSYKDVIEEFGGFNAALKSNGDSDLSGKISSKYKIVYKEDIIVNHPARYHTEDLVNKYRRLLGGAYTRRFQENKWSFTPHVLNFILRRYRFSLKKFFTVPINESWAIFKVCTAINLGAVQEYFNLIRGGETKR
ncbi:glycosyltransferase family 2 protein [Echinicola salinicaeni]|uniref:glycosyltransferase family 2 protein n=1 Tax=Echinicola salinicaeni TaxID=2762757 RepID=UPI001646836F|nr:glycosyltransferase family A protein [Echinicola salinicaeni]